MVGAVRVSATKRSTKSMKQKILLVTTVVWSSAARLAGAFSRLGAQVEAVFPRGHALGVSRYLGGAHRYRPLAPLTSLAKAIDAAAPDRVIACDDRALALLLRLDSFAPLLEASLGPLASYRVLMARAPAIAAARQEGIPAPLTLAVDSLSDLSEALQAVGFPCVMKTDFSSGGDGVKFVGSTAEAEQAFVRLQGPPSRARSLVRAVLRRDAHFLGAALHPAAATVSLQAFIPGKPATSVFAAKDGQVLAAQHMNVLSWHGDTGPASLMQRVADPAMDEAARKIAARFRLSGLQGLDFVRDAKGEPQLIEVNPRATQICHLPLDADLPAALLGVPPRAAATDLRQIALFPQVVAMADLPCSVYRDIPWEDPKVLRAMSGAASFETSGLEDFIEFGHPGSHPGALRRHG
jgi:hypothetical protein